MQINQHIITSIQCFRRHFEFKQVWYQIDVFIRDMSPINIPYLKGTDILYKIIREPSCVKYESYNNVFVVDNSKYVLQFNDLSLLSENKLLQLSQNEKIQILALFELAGKIINISELETYLNVDINSSAEEIVLSHGQALSIAPNYKYDINSENLVIRLIRISKSSPTPCWVDGQKINKGDFIFGIFLANQLIQTLPKYSENERYKIRTLEKDNLFVTEITDKKYGVIESYNNVISHCILKNDNYAYIENNKVYFAKDPAQEKLLNGLIQLQEKPLMILYKDGTIKLFLNSNRIESFKFN